MIERTINWQRRVLGIALGLSFLAAAVAAAEPHDHAKGASGSSTAAVTGKHQKGTEKPGAVAVSRQRSPYARHRGMVGSAHLNYQLDSGIDNLQVRRSATGNLIRLSYVVVDPEKAKVLSDKLSEPLLIDPADGVMLKIPVMEKIGPLRQTETPVAGKAYSMVFSNQGNYVKAGDKVDVVIGTFHAEGLHVE